MYFSSDELRWINRIRQLASMHPDQVKIIAQPDTNDGCIYASLPVKWLRIAPPSQRSPLTDAQKQAAAERLRLGREAHKKEG